MPRLTPRQVHGSTRKSRGSAFLVLCGALAVASLAGCATPGPLHVYSLPRDTPEEIADHGESDAAGTPAFLESEDRVVGFAYDPFTDHFFLRLAPGTVIRVVDRPARKIKRAYKVEGLTAGGDLAVRPKDGHLFCLEMSPLRIAEVTRYGKLLGRITPQGVASAVAVGYDAARDELLLLGDDGQTVSMHEPTGRRKGSVQLERRVLTSIAADGERGEIYAPLADGPGKIGVFDRDGKLQRELPVHGRFVDVGPRSFIRVF